MKRSEVLHRKIEQLASGVERLSEIMRMEGLPHDVKRDAAIQRFEFCYEMAWKTLKAWVAEDGVIVSSPRDTLRAAFADGLLGEDADGWMRMLADRNTSSHVYNESLAQTIYENIESQYCSLFEQLIATLRAKDSK